VQVGTEKVWQFSEELGLPRAVFINKLDRERADWDTCVADIRKSLSEKATPIQAPYTNVIDTCGTGGDGAHTFNISTTAAFVVAGAGIPVAKHGNRSVSSRCGSADLLQELGVTIELTPEMAERCLAEVGITFLFAPLFHRAMQYAIGPRREIAVRTIFNLLGPLTNPAAAKHQLVGVYARALTAPVAVRALSAPPVGGLKFGWFQMLKNSARN